MECVETIYEYDSMYRLVSTTATTSQNKELSVDYTYSKDLLTQVATKSSTYHFGYGDFSLRTSTSVGTQILATYTYTDDAYHRLACVAYGNGDKVEYIYDEFGRVTEEKYYENGSTSASRTIVYEYNASGALATTVDKENGITTKYYYDTVGRNTGIRQSGGNGTNSLYYTYDELGRIQTVREKYNGTNYYTGYEYNGNSQVIEVNAGDSTEDYCYDEYERLAEWKTYHGNADSPLIKKAIDYDWFIDDDENQYTLDRPKVWSYEADGYKVYYTYGYDANGNIVSETRKQILNGVTTQKTTTYVYDSANQLIRENNEAANKTWVWTYNNAGNILSEIEYAYTTGTPGTPQAVRNYTYGNTNWGDLLTKYNGKSISYDAIGNPLSDGIWNYTWQEGRKLAAMSKGNTTWAFTYDVNGMRTKRASGSTVYNYTYHGSQLTHMTYGSNELHFYYDASGRPLSFTYRDATGEDVIYYYVLNVQGDVVGILDSTGKQVVGYVYDAWGRLMSTTGEMASTLGAYNPLLYRGYVYDRETGLYYVSSRYYEPENGRFLNTDSALYHDILGYNMFAYCYNDPVNYFDPTGESAVSIFGTWLTGGGIIAAAEPTFVGEIILVASIIVLGGIVVVDKIVTTVKNKTSETTKDIPSNDKSKSKDKDSRLTGEPGEVKKEGSKETLIGPDGKATKERHWTDHGKPKYHSNPHDHDISWDVDGNPNFGSSQNYWDGNIPIFP